MQAMIQSAINKTQNNALSAQQRGRATTSNKFSRIENLKGKVRVLDLQAKATPQVIYFDYDGFARAGATLITDVMRNYEKWALDELVVHYTPLVSKTAHGSVSFAPDFDPADPPAPDAQSMSVSDYYQSWSVSDSVSIPLAQPYSRQRPEDMLFVSPVSDTRLTSEGYGNFIVSSTMTDDTVVGYIELSYSIRLFLKTPNPPTDATWVDQECTIYNNDTNLQNLFSEELAYSNKLYMQAESTFTPGEVVSAIVGSVSHGSLIDTRKNEVPSGTRIFFKPARALIDTVNNYITRLGHSGYISQVSLDRNFTIPVSWVGTSAIDGVLNLFDLRYAA